MLYRNAELLILDEPTSVLTEQEIGKLFETLRSLQKGGRTCIIITHKLQEVLEISNRLTVMRKGAVVAVRTTAEVPDRRSFARLMVGRNVLYPLDRAEKACGAPSSASSGVTLTQKGRGRPLLRRREPHRPLVRDRRCCGSERQWVGGAGGRGVGSPACFIGADPPQRGRCNAHERGGSARAGDGLRPRGSSAPRLEPAYPPLRKT